MTIAVMTLRSIAATLILLTGTALPALAQTPAPAAPAPADPEGNPAARFQKIAKVFDGAIYPVFRSVAPGGGFGPGVGYRAGRKESPWQFRTEALVTMRKYTSLDAALQYPRGWLQGEVYGRVRDMKRLDFYGLGGGATGDDRTTYRFVDRAIGTTLTIRPMDFDKFEFGGRLEKFWPDIRHGMNPKFPSLEERFAESAAPGFAKQPAFFAHTEFIGLMLPGGPEKSRLGADVRLTHRGYRDNGDGHYSFGRVELDAQQRLPGATPSQRLTLHQYFSTANVPEGHEVPFYLQQTLGGTSAVRSFHETTLGSDGTQATLRGFRNLRFRGTHVMLFQAEYRFKVRGPVEATVFGEAGNVAMQRSALSLRDLKKDVGFSLSYVKKEATLARLDIAGGGGEGIRVSLNFGGLLQK
jgi:hypothetical protein